MGELQIYPWEHNWWFPTDGTPAWMPDYEEEEEDKKGSRKTVKRTIRRK